MFDVVINAFAEDVLDKVSKKDKKSFLKIVEALDDLEKFGLDASNIKSLQNASKIFRKRVGRWRILFTFNKNIIDVWIIAIEKDTSKDYKRWISLISLMK